MKVLNFGSLNIDYVYNVPHFVAAGETLSSTGLECFCGGKGLNQSVAFARAGGKVYHAGCIGAEGGMLTDMLVSAGVDTHLVKTVRGSTGHAIIQVNAQGNNCILLFGGANQMMTEEYIDSVLSEFEAGDLLVLQNEINLNGLIVDKAKALGMVTVLNPSPFDSRLDSVDFGKIDYLLVNETEGGQISGRTEPDEIIDRIRAMYPDMKILLTLGSDGAVYDDGNTRVRHPIFDVDVVDTTAAGDTFTGFFITSVTGGKTPSESLRIASAASAISVSRKGAAPSVPTMAEVETFLSAR